MKSHGIEIINLHKNFKDIQALKGVSLKIDKPGLYGIIGPNGAGKTTLLKCISNLLIPSEGEVFVNNQIINPKDFSFSKKMGFLPEDSGLYEKLTAKEFLHIMAGLYGLSDYERKHSVKEIVEYVGIAYPPSKIVKFLSTGQRRLLLFASILLHDPDILILDESLSGLDPINREHIAKLMRKLAEEKIVLFSSHILSDIWKLCEKIYVLNNGEIILEDNPESILSRMSDDSYFIIPKIKLDDVKQFLDNLKTVDSIRVQGDKITFRIQKSTEVSDVIRTIIEKYDVISFGPNIPDLDEIFTRMVSAE